MGHTDKSIMAEKAEVSNRWVILFDEIEKAHHKFYDFLLSLLDDGTCTDNMGRVLDFSESIFIFTSNQGVSDIAVGDKLGFGHDTVTTIDPAAATPVIVSTLSMLAIMRGLQIPETS